MSQFFRKLSAAVGIAPRADRGNNRDGSKLPLTATLDASDEAFDMVTANGNDDDLASLKTQLQEAKAELLAARAKHVDEVACSNGCDRQSSPPQAEPEPLLDQATVDSLQQQLLLRDHALVEKCKELSCVVDCSEKILTYATVVNDRYETDNTQLRKDLQTTEASLASAKTTLAEGDAALKSMNAALEREQRSNSLLRSESQTLQDRLLSTEHTLDAKVAEIARLEQKLKVDAADQQDRVRRLHEILVAKEDAIKKEQQTTLRRQSEVDSLSKRLAENEKALQAKIAEVARLDQKIRNVEGDRQKSICLMQQAIAEKDRQHAEEVDTMGDEIRAAEHASERSERKLERKRATLAEDYRFIRSLITGNPRLVTVANVEDVLKLTQRHSTDNDDVKRVCEERLDHFHNLLPATKKYELAVKYDLGFAFVKSLIVANQSVITAENIGSVLKLLKQNGDFCAPPCPQAIRVCEERLRQFGDTMPLTRKYELVVNNGLNVNVIRTIVQENPLLITEQNVGAILNLADRHPSTNDAIKRVCEQRIRHFSQLLTRKCELFLRHALDMQLLGRIVRDNSKSLTAEDVENILKLVQRYPCNNNAVKRECESRLRHVRDLNLSQKYELAKKYSLHTLQQELKAKIDAQKAAAKPFRFGLPRSFFAVEHDYDFRRTTDNGQVFRSGGLVYVRPLGCERFALKGKQYKIVLQVRVDPTRLTRHDNGNIYLLPDGSSIRPYAVCVFAA